jgi:1,4-dihydroxy-2-naphthoyl-CoA hydrolase
MQDRRAYENVKGHQHEGASMRVEGNIEFTILEQRPEQVVSEMPVQPGILNPYGVVHAGAILWFADVTATILAMGSTQFEEAGAGFPLAISLNANFTGNQKAGSFRAVASFVKKGRTVSVVRTIVLGENDKLIADVSTNHVAAR